MDLHEYQAKALLKKYGLPIGDFVVVKKEEEIEGAFKALGVSSALLKAQIHAGARGKAGGVRRAGDLAEAKNIAHALLNRPLVTRQTTPQGLIVNCLLMEAAVSIRREYYLAITIDADTASRVLVASKKGGMEVESHHETLSIPVLSEGRLRSYHLVELVKFLDMEKHLREPFCASVQRLARAAAELDAKLIEINPLVETGEGKLQVLDAKMVIDDNSLFRHPDLAAQFDYTQVSPMEAKAMQSNLSYVSLDGNIGCMVNGAGLAMATMDLLKAFQGSAANFLDIGGNADKTAISLGFSLILSDPRVQALFINIFGGIVDCALLAETIVEVAQARPQMPPLVVRMEGTHAEKACKILFESGLKVQFTTDLSEGAKQVLQEANGSAQ